MPTFHIEMYWQCSTCQTENLGRHKSCTHCGKVKEGEPFYDKEAPDIANAVTDPELIKQAAEGSDWECIYCRSHQRRANGDCANCGAAQGESRDHQTKWDDGKVGPGGSGPTELERIEAEFKDEPSLSPTPDVEEKPDYSLDIDPEQIGAKRARRHRLFSFLVIAACSVLVLGIFYLIFRTREVEAAVISRAWTHKVHVERYQAIQGEGFAEDKPGDAFDVTPLGERHHHDDRVLDRYEDEPYEESYVCGEKCTKTPVVCRNNDNGFKTCSGGDQTCSPKYCSRTKYRKVAKYKNVPVYAMWYRWKVWRWRHHRTVVESGQDDVPFWPSADKIALDRNCTQGEREREKQRESFYVIGFKDTEGEAHSYKPKTEAEFSRFKRGSKHRLRVGIAHGTEVLN